ncbi:hypothetical protein Lalb_Chr06g0167901 [Lupinus albus]|uniref:Uncharacterized protein n=1 Tax=Lupinus albus TaxID=3870 RepID=A0A6A4QDE4_LUPAL|nr:hypothetical protein Lalb_Chr06g0167901 [Lupinus albus]
MAGYGYTYLSISTYNTVRDETLGPVVKPFVPFVPNTNSNLEGQVTKKTIVPVSTKPYVDEYHDTGYGYGSPSKVDEFITEVQNEASHPRRSTPVSSTDRRHLPQPTSVNNGANGYGNHGSNKEGHKLLGYDGRNGYGDYGSNKEGLKPIGVTFRNDNYDGYNNPNDNGAFDSKEGYKSNGSPIRNGNYDGYNGANNGYGGYINKEGHIPYGSSIKNDNYDGFHGGNGYDDYGNYGKKEGYKPFGSPILSANYDRHHPAENYGATGPNRIIPGKPKISTVWTMPPRKGTQLSEPTNDIDKVVKMLKEAANLSGHNNKGGHNYEEPTSKFGNIGSTHSRYSVPIEQSSPNKDYQDAATGWEYAERY